MTWDIEKHPKNKSEILEYLNTVTDLLRLIINTYESECNNEDKYEVKSIKDLINKNYYTKDLMIAIKYLKQCPSKHLIERQTDKKLYRWSEKQGLICANDGSHPYISDHNLNNSWRFLHRDETQIYKY
jgi:hypothetical protein